MGKAAAVVMVGLAMTPALWGEEAQTMDVPLPAYEVLKEPTDAEQHVVDPSAIKGHYQYLLHLTETDTRVLLARALETTEHSESLYGMDEGTLRVQWAEPDRLLQVSWNTMAGGSGLWVVGGLLLLERDGTGWREVYRDFYDKCVRGGADSSDRWVLSFRLVPESRQLMLERVHDSVRPGREGLPLLDRHEWEGHVSYLQSTKITTEWPCEPCNGRWTCEEGAAYLELGESAFPIEEVAQYIAEGNASLDNAVRRLRQMNPGLANATVAMGRTKIDDHVPPYSPNPAHRYHIDNL